MTLRSAVVVVVATSCLGGAASAQVVREDGVKSIAGAVGAGVGFVEWTFSARGDEILFASLDAFIYEQREPHDILMAAGSGCEDEGGPSRLCLQVIDGAGQVVCSATRPTPPPGWQRDPRLACRLPSAVPPASYSVRVAQVSMGMEEGSCTVLQPAVGLPGGDFHPFLLNISLRRLAPSGANIQSAVAQSLSLF